MKPSPLHSCNVLELRAGTRHLWSFAPQDGKATLTLEQVAPADAPLPAAVVRKNWQALWQKKLNIAWLPADQVFLRVMQLPKADLPETRSMVELQLEKASPLPVGQIVWSFELVPSTMEKMQSVVAVIAARTSVESFLGRLETKGYLPDRLELPHLHELNVRPVEGNVVRIYLPQPEDTRLALVAWWFEGALQNVQMVRLPSNSAGVPALVEHLTKTAWSGETEGWLTGAFAVEIVTPEAGSIPWQDALQQWTGQPVRRWDPLSQQKLAELAALRASNAESQANLLPPEYAAQYRQQFVDRLWMGGLGGIIAVYVVAVLIYLGFLQFLRFQQTRVESQVKAISGSYTNALRLKEHGAVLQEQFNLKYAALDCWKVASEMLPADLTLRRLILRDGRSFRIEGIVPSEQVHLVTDYNEMLRQATLDGLPLFRSVDPPKLYVRQGSGGATSWDFNCEVNRADLE